MNKYEIVSRIEKFAPPELAESWDCSGWAVETKSAEITKIMLALTVTEDIINQARERKCNMIISHHPLFCVPINWSDINIYSAHTNLDRTNGGTTDTLIKTLGFQLSYTTDFVRYVNQEITLSELIEKLSKVSPNLRFSNPKQACSFKKLAFCAGSGSEFINEAYENGADAFVTGDLKFHTALESPIAIFDIGHFESEILVLKVFESLLSDINTIRATETSPFIYLK